MTRVEAGADPMCVVRDPRNNGIIELAQEDEKYNDGQGYLLDALEKSHARHCPIKEEIRMLLGRSETTSPGGT